MTLDYVLKHRNVNNKVYDCDIREWMGVDLPNDKMVEISDLLTELSDKGFYGQK